MKIIKQEKYRATPMLDAPYDRVRVTVDMSVRELREMRKRISDENEKNTQCQQGVKK